MKLTEMQAMYMFVILKDTLTIDDGGILSYGIESRRKMYNEIFSQFDDKTLIEFQPLQGENDEQND